MSKKLRSIADPKSGVGGHRYELYCQAWDRINDALLNGYYLESIALLESLLSDRLESRASFLTGQNEGFQTLGNLIKTFMARETDAAFLSIVNDIDSWRIERNKALHELVKFQPCERPTWQEKTANLKRIVTDGKELAERFHQIDSQERQNGGARPPASWPEAFRDRPSPTAASLPTATPSNQAKKGT